MTTLEKKIQKKVDEINNLISLASNSESDNAYDGNLMVTDTSSTWEEPAIYKPIIFRNGVLYIEYFEPYSNRTKKDKILKRNLEFDGYGTLLDIAKIYRRALKKENIKYAGGGDFQSGVYAGGGKVKPFMYKEKNSTIMINGTKADVKKMYLDYKNNFLSVSKFAEYYNISETQANSIINEGRKYAKEDGYYAGGGSFEKVKWQDVEVGDSARVKEINRMGLIVKTYGRKFHLKFPNGTEKTFDASELEFIKDDNDKYAGGGEFMTDPTFGSFQNNVYADGGVTENYVSRRNLNTITIKKGNQKLTYKISDVLNGAYKLESGAKLEDIAFYVPKRSIVKVQLKTGKDFKPANGYWIKDGAKPIHVTKFDDGGVMSRLLTRKKDQPKVETTDEDIDLKEDSRIRVRPSSFVRKDKEADWMMKNNSSKEARTYADGGKIRYEDYDDEIDMWDKLSISQRKKILDSQEDLEQYGNHSEIAQDDWDELDDYVTDVLENNFKNKMYAGGGSVENIVNKEADELIKKLEAKGISAKKRVSKNGVFIYGEKNQQGKYKYETYLSYSEIPDKNFLEIEMLEFLRLNKKIYAGGGKTTFSEKAKAIAKNFEGKRVEPKYQKEYGKVYDTKEAKEVGNKIAGSQKTTYDAKAEKGAVVKKGKGNHKMKATTDLAKKIRKDGEKWTDAIKRASLQLK